MQIVRARPANLQLPDCCAERRLELCPVVKVSTGEGVGRAQALHRSLEDHLSAGATGMRSQIDHVVGDRDDLRLVFDHEHGVALVAQLQQQRVHARDVVRMQSDGRLVEDVRHVSQRRSEMTDHLGALCLPAGQGAGRPFQGQISQADLYEGVEGVPKAGQQRSDRSIVQALDPSRQVADLHGTRIGDVDAFDLGGTSSLIQAGAAAVRTCREHDRAFDEGPDVRLHRVDVLGQQRLLNLGDQPLVGDVDPFDLDPGGLLVQQRVEFPFRELRDRLVRVEETTSAVDTSVPAVHAVPGDGQRPFTQ